MGAGAGDGRTDNDLTTFWTPFAGLSGDGGPSRPRFCALRTGLMTFSMESIAAFSNRWMNLQGARSLQTKYVSRSELALHDSAPVFFPIYQCN